MLLTDYHAKYFAHELTRRHPPDSVEKLTGALVDAQVDLNPHRIDAALESHRASLQRRISERNTRFFEAETGKLDAWADDLKLGLEREIKELDRQIKDARRLATTALTLEEKLAGQKQIEALESQRNGKRRALFDAQDEVDRQRDGLIAGIEGRLQQRATLADVLFIRWVLR
jgi:adenine-specific DNA-methyltransferase